MKVLAQMTLEEKIGQLFVCGFQGTEPTEAIKDMIQTYKVGGVIYFSRNVESPKQVHEMSLRLKAISKEINDTPLFVGMDQEGGMVARLTEGITLVPGNMALGAVDDEALTEAVTTISGQELRALGVNMNFAPSIDVNNNPDNPVIGVRSFGDQPGRVGDLGIAAVKGYQAAGICSSVKHFPGHGDTSADSHFALPSIPHDKKRVNEVELVPFKKAITYGTDMVMTAHIVFPEIETSGKPATLSYEMLTGMLRQTLGYDGVIVTDCLEMEAISETYGTDHAAVMAMEAGADLLLISHTQERQQAAIKAVKEAVREGRLSEERIDQSVGRILALKDKRELEQSDLAWTEASQQLRKPDNVDTATYVSEKSVTVITDQTKQLPLTANERTMVITPALEALNAADESFAQRETLADYLTQQMTDVRHVDIPTAPTDKDIQKVLSQSDTCDRIICLTYNAAMFPQQIELVSSLQAQANDRLIVVALRNPFDFIAFPEVSTQIACYESRPLALESVAKVLLGQMSPQGRLPVSLRH